MIRYLSAAAQAVAAFVRAADIEAAKSPSGRPHLEGWNRDDNPYEKLFKTKAITRGPKVIGALVFAQGCHRNIYLREGTYTVGDGCMNDIVTTSDSFIPSLCTLHMSSSGLRIIATSGVPMSVNSQPCDHDDLIDQDVISVGGVTFFYLELGGNDAGH